MSMFKRDKYKTQVTVSEAAERVENLNISFQGKNESALHCKYSRITGAIGERKRPTPTAGIS
jgi:hypothetical protein